VETHQAELQKHLVVYTNSDSNSRGFLEAGGSHSLERFITQIAREVVDPQRNVPVYERLRAHDLTTATNVEERKEALERDLIRLEALGSGSDFTPFLQHAGIAALSIGYGGEGEGGSYHSIYDSFDHYTRFGDPSFAYGVTQAKTTGRITLRMANADLLPFEFTTVATTIGRYADEVAQLAESMRKSTEERNRLVNEHLLEIAADPTETFVAPPLEAPVPFLNFAPLQNAVARLRKSADEFGKAYGSALNGTQTEALDRALMHAEQAFTREEGLPRRPWYRHQIYAPGFYTGYGVKTLPGVREAIEQRKWSEANAQIGVVAKVIEEYAAEVDRAAEIARGKGE
jgi:N-acetylated-alpha-linked acidic dipeptidase